MRYQADLKQSCQNKRHKMAIDESKFKIPSWQSYNEDHSGSNGWKDEPPGLNSQGFDNDVCDFCGQADIVKTDLGEHVMELHEEIKIKTKKEFSEFLESEEMDEESSGLQLQHYQGVSSEWE
jgi:hypothetical protein